MRISPRLKLERAAVARLVEDLASGSTVTAVRSMRGGVRRRVFSVTWREPSGTSRRLVIRLAPEPGGPAKNALSEFKTLSSLYTAGLPVPRPLLVDAEQKYFELPAIVMEHAGRPVIDPPDWEGWLRSCADTLSTLHALSPSEIDLSHLEQSTLDERRADQEKSLTPEHLQRFEEDELMRAVAGALQSEAQNQVTVAPRLVHDDYWPGNILWRRGRISAVIDWTEATLSDPARDVAQLQIDISLMFGLDYAKKLRESYALASGGLPTNLRYVQLYGIRPAYAHLADWYLPGYLDLGMRLTPSLLDERFREYIRWVLDRGD